jgi:predicted metal-dependent phosphoesterase TrpH
VNTHAHACREVKGHLKETKEQAAKAGKVAGMEAELESVRGQLQGRIQEIVSKIWDDVQSW